MSVYADHVRVTVEFAQVLERLGIRYVVGSSVAASFWSKPRATADTDFAAELEVDRIEPLIAALGEGWYVDAVLAEEAARSRRSFNVVRLSPFVKIDVFVPPDEGIHPNKWDRARRRAIGGAEVAITSPEDVVLQKLDWFRAGGEVAHQQLIDVVEVLRYQEGAIDDAYLDEWAERIGVADLLERVRESASGRA